MSKYDELVRALAEASRQLSKAAGILAANIDYDVDTDDVILRTICDIVHTVQCCAEDLRLLSLDPVNPPRK